MRRTLIRPGGNPSAGMGRTLGRAGGVGGAELHGVGAGFAVYSHCGRSGTSWGALPSLSAPALLHPRGGN